MTFTAGTKLGAYEIVGPLGAGGMGEVYRARDPKLKREVAIKVLPDEFSSDADRITRFRREAEVLASLNHSNIAAIYDFEESNGARFLVLELVEGETLADRVRTGPMGVDQALSIARQIAEGLEAAHAKNIVHRDLKPANVKITPQGSVKILDFGLAKVFDKESSSSDFSKSPTLLSGTMAGVILGTAAYMSPEQARGQSADAQSDIWAFGCVLYELLTGKQAFTGDTLTDVLGGIVRVDPDWTALPAATPPLIRLLLRQCLQKPLNSRLHHIGDAKIQIDASLSEPAVPAVPSGSLTVQRHPWLWIVACALLLLAAAGMAPYVVRYFRLVASSPGTIRFSVPPPEATSFNSAGGVNAPYVTISPDGRQISFIAASEGRNRVWIRSLDSLEARPLTGTEGVAPYPPFWSPDSRFIAFGHQGKLKKIEVAGGPVQTICDAPNFEGGTWNRDGIIIFDEVQQGEGPLKWVSAAGGKPETLTALDPSRHDQSHAWPHFLPDGDHFLFLARSRAPENSAIFAGSLSSKQTTLVINAHSRMAYDRSGFLLFVRETSLMAQPFDARKLRASGDAFPIAEQVRYNPAPGQASLGVSDNGVLVYRAGNFAGNIRLTWLDRSGKALGEAAPIGAYRNPELSPDDRRIAVQQQDPRVSTDDIWVIDAARGVPIRLTSNPAADQFPVWSPDGSRILFQREGLYAIPSNGTGEEELILKTPARLYDWSADALLAIYGIADDFGAFEFWSLPILGERKPTLYIKSEFRKSNAQLSPDGRWLAYQSIESGRNEVYIQSFPNPSAKLPVSTAGGVSPRWRGDGKELFYLAPDRYLMSVVMRPSPTVLEPSTPTRLFVIQVPPVFLNQSLRQPYDVTRDGSRFIVTSPVESADTPITISVNWAAGLKR